MKTLVSILVVATLFFTSTMLAQKTITATVINVTSNAGEVGFALYDKSNFMMKPLQTKKAKIENGKSVVIFENIKEGEYAVTCYHDKNNNGKMDFSPRGMPLEDYGASNNVMSFGPPKYDDAKFTVTDKNVSLEIKF